MSSIRMLLHMLGNSLRISFGVHSIWIYLIGKWRRHFIVLLSAFPIVAAETLV
jgi:hypothetical protein